MGVLYNKHKSLYNWLAVNCVHETVARKIHIKYGFTAHAKFHPLAKWTDRRIYSAENWILNNVFGSATTARRNERSVLTVSNISKPKSSLLYN